MGSRKVLVIEKAEDTRRSLEKVTRSLKFDTTVSANIDDVAGEIRAGRYDAVIVDFGEYNNVLPTILLAANHAPASTTIVVAVDQATNEDELKTLRSRDLTILIKPVVETALLNALNTPPHYPNSYCEQGDVACEIHLMQEALKGQAAILGRLASQVSALAQRLLPRSRDEKLEKIMVGSPHDIARESAGIRQAMGWTASLSDKAIASHNQNNLERAVDTFSVRLNARNTNEMNDRDGLELLSSRELSVIALIQAGMTTEDIADRLHISPDTVKTHRRNIRRKLDIIGKKDDLASYLRALHGNKQRLHETTSEAPRPGIVASNDHAGSDQEAYNLNRRFRIGRRLEDRRDVRDE